MVVEECNLRAQIVALRRALGDDGNFSYIVTVPGRGYRFVAPVTVQTASEETLPVPYARAEELTLPRLPCEVIGRDTLIASLADQLLSQRFVTLTGPGGIGKTTVALAVARELARAFTLDTCFVDLAPATSGQWVTGILASALGIRRSAITRCTASRRPWPTAVCCWCWITANTCCRPPPTPWKPC